MARDAELIVRHLALISDDVRALLSQAAHADGDERTVLRGTAYDRAGSGAGGYGDPTAHAALSMRRERGRTSAREAREKVLAASQLLTEARAVMARAGHTTNGAR